MYYIAQKQEAATRFLEALSNPVCMPLQTFSAGHTPCSRLELFWLTGTINYQCCLAFAAFTHHALFMKMAIMISKQTDRRDLSSDKFYLLCHRSNGTNTIFACDPFAIVVSKIQHVH